MDRRSPLRRAAVLGAAYSLDRLIGDPVRPTHPARILGRAIAVYEKSARLLLARADRRAAGDPPGDRAAERARRERRAGFVLAAGLPLLTYGVVRRVLAGAPRPLRFGIEVWLTATALAGRDLGQHAREVERRLDLSLEDARRGVAMIVGRDTAALDEAGVVRATVETVAENTSDGVVAPLVYAAAGGAPLALAYKAVSTMDSMVGYKNERYLHLGRYAARLDDAANLLPARLTAVLATLAARRGPAAAARWWQDRRHHASPNAGLVEASFAQALRVRLGGGAVYGGHFVQRPHVGGEYPDPRREDIVRAIDLSERVALLTLAVSLGILGGLALRGPRDSRWARCSKGSRRR